jgi:septal ring factor EnvC (AmiA/AmiB activator)
MLKIGNEIWDWYNKRSKWQKIAFFVFICLAIAAIFVLDFTRQMFDPHYMVKRNKDRMEKSFEKEFARVEKKDKVLKEQLKQNSKKRENLIAKRKKIVSENKDKHEKIDDASSFDDVDDVIHGKR